MSGELRKIIHIDMDAFYASVEQRDHPEWRGKPLVVGGRPGQRGVVAAASYEARRFGIHSAMPSTTAHQRCPHAIFVKPRFEVYRSVSQQIRAIFMDYTEKVEPLSLDEAYLDVTTNKKGNPSATWVAEEIRQRIFRETRLTASAGVAPNKFLAKIASDINKPNGIYVLPPHRVIRFVEALPIGKFYGIGKATEKKMNELGIYSGADLKNLGEAACVRHFGKTGSFYYNIARGIDTREVSPRRRRKSVGVEETFVEDLTSPETMKNMLWRQAQELEERLRKAGLSGKTITLKLRFANFETITRAETQTRFQRKARAFFDVAQRLLDQSGAGKKRVRLLGITVSNLDNQVDPLGEIQLFLPFGEDFEF